jgi:hypothetical protein
MNAQKVFINDDGNTVIRCPKCGLEREIPVQKLAGKHSLKVKCRCSALFSIEVELRKRYRKDTNLDGFLQKLYLTDVSGRMLYESETTNIKVLNCKIVNISKAGLGVTIMGPHTIEKGDHIKAKFTLDNSARTEIEKKALVKWVKDSELGCEFLDEDKEDKTIAFYLL